MSKNALHALLAVEPSLNQQATLMMSECESTFTKKGDHFEGLVKNYSPFNEGDDMVPPETKEVVTTVQEKLDYVKAYVIKALDATLSKEETNASGVAVAPLMVGGKNFGTYSAIGYLALEKFLLNIRKQYQSIPTLDPVRSWSLESQTGRTLYISPVEVKYRTVKKTKVITLAPPTDKHPAQVQLVADEMQVGKYDTVYSSGKLSPGDKSKLLGRIDELIQAVKLAKELANQADAKQVTLGASIFEFIHK
jgi:hypothetical protein